VFDHAFMLEVSGTKVKNGASRRRGANAGDDLTLSGR
jgi:hypothetical protein